jgi:hypothetical protein
MRGIACVFVVMTARGHAEPREIYIPITRAESLTDDEDVAGAYIALPIEKRRDSLLASVVDFGRGRVMRTQLRWDNAEPGWYHATVRADVDDQGRYQLAVALDGSRTFRAVRVGKRDAERIHEITSGDFEYVAHVGKYGVDLDRNGRADLAFAHVCEGLAGPSGEQVCSRYDWIVVRRVRNAWQLPRRCRPELRTDKEPCWRW